MKSKQPNKQQLAKQLDMSVCHEISHNETLSLDFLLFLIV